MRISLLIFVAGIAFAFGVAFTTYHSYKAGLIDGWEDAHRAYADCKCPGSDY